MTASRRKNWVVLATLGFLVGACAGNGCNGCALEELPGGALPAAQTVEGGAQIRVTSQGFAKLKDIASEVLNDVLSEGMCMPSGAVGLGVGDLHYCFGNDDNCTNSCKVGLTVDSLAFTPQPGSLRLRTQFDVVADVPAQLDTGLGVIGPCTLTVTATNNIVDADITLAIRPEDGELDIQLGNISELNLNPVVTGCDFVGSVVNFLAGTLADLLEDQFVANLLRPMIEDLLQGMLPDPLGIEGKLAVGDLLGQVQPDVNANLEARVIPGGYAFLERGGLSVGVITGFNADEDPATRSPDLASEPALCVPRFGAPSLSLPTTIRQTFRMDGADLFRGQPEPSGDVAFGVSDSFLDLVGHHLVSSGALCLGIGTAEIPQLNLGALGLFVPSLAELGGRIGDDPLLLISRPLKPISFKIGDGTAGSPALTMHVEDLEIDFYAFLFERYTRAFTLSLDLDVGLDLEFTTDADGKPAVLPILSGIDPKDVEVAVLNHEFLREDKAELEATLPAVLDVALQLLDDNLEPISLPEFAGFSLDDLTTQKVTTSQDDFLAITATLGAGSMFRLLADKYPSIAARLEDATVAKADAAPAGHDAPRLLEVDTPPIAEVGAALGGQGGRLPTAIVAVPTTDSLGRTLEWTWSLGGGLWRSFQPGGELRISDRAFAFQGRYEVHLRARAVGDYRTLDADAAVIPFVIDSVAPSILVDQLAVEGDDFVVPAIDRVSPPALVALGVAGAERPTTEWTDGRFDVETARRLARQLGNGELTIFAKDALGNQTVLALEAPDVLFFHGGDNDDHGCSCGVTRGSDVAGVGLALALAALIGLGRRRGPRGRRLTLAVLAALGLGGLGGSTGCGDENTCDLASECSDACTTGQIPLCLDGECVCQAALATGAIGQYSEMAVDTDGTIWVSAYNRTHGDLMVAAVDAAGRIPDEAWTFVDGVPEGPVTVEGTEVRGGIAAPGPDVGEFTDIAVADGVAMVSYFDRDSTSLKFASNQGGEWQSHAVDGGRSGDAGFMIAGQYSSITRGGDGHLGIAYLAVAEASGGDTTTELRFADAKTPNPKSAADWTIYVVDTAVVPGTSELDPLPVPGGTGLFATAARLPDGRPIVVYYDRLAGDLEMATWDGDGFGTPEALDGADGSDVGWFPGVHVEADGKVHVTYVSASNDDLLYVNSVDRTPEVIDDGYRLVGQTDDGLPKPEFHFVGDDSAIVMTDVGPYAAYQDATTHELLVANRGPDGSWRHKVLKGDEDPFAGGYGFYASGALFADKLVISNWVIDQPSSESWVEIIWATPAVID